MPVQQGLPSSIPNVPYGVFKEGYSLFELVFKVSHMMYKQVFSAKTPVEAKKLGEEFCRVHGFMFVTVNPFIVDLNDAIQKRQRQTEIKSEPEKVEEVKK